MRITALSIGIFMMTGAANAVPGLTPYSGSSDSSFSGVSFTYFCLEDFESDHPPTHAGIVWTDVGNIRSTIGFVPVIFETFGETGVSATGARVPGSIDWEVDHLQHGSTALPTPGTYILARTGLGMLPFVCRRLGPLPFE